jgi:peptidyl-prolyl cis-trans isomerase SurA
MRWAMVAAALLCSGAASAANVVDRIAAVVNEDVIALSQVYDLGGPFIESRCEATTSEACLDEAEREVLDTLIQWALISAELRRLSMEVTGADIDDAINQWVADAGVADRAELRIQVEASGTRWDSAREQLANTLRTQRFQQVVLSPRVTVTEDEILDRYQRTVRGERHEEVALEALGVLIGASATEEEALALGVEAVALVESLNAGELTWEEAVAEHDDAKLADVVGGRSYQRGDLTDTLDSVAFDGELGVVADPVRVGNVLFVIKPVSRDDVEGDVLPYEQAKEGLRNALLQEKVEEVAEEWYQRARRSSVVQVLLGS